VQRSGTTFVVWSLLGLLAVCCCAMSAQAQDGKTYWQVDGGGGSGTRAVMTLDGGRLRFVRSTGEVASYLIPDGAEYFAGQRSGNTISGFFAYSLLQPSRCAPAYSGELILSGDGRSFTLTAAAHPKREPSFDDEMCKRYGDNMPTCRGRNRVEPSCGSAFRPADVTRGVQILWPSREVVAAVAPPVIARLPDVATPSKAVEKIAQAARPVASTSNDLAIAPERTDQMIAVVLLAVVVACWLLFSNGTAARFVARLLVRLARWLALGVAVVAMLLGVCAAVTRLDRPQGSATEWVVKTIIAPVAQTVETVAPSCGHVIYNSPQQNIDGCKNSVLQGLMFWEWRVFSRVPTWYIPSLGQSPPAAQSGVAAALWWMWDWVVTIVSAPFRFIGWVFGKIGDAFLLVGVNLSAFLQWLATPFINFFWLLYTIGYWLLWVVWTIIVWVVWLLWSLLGLLLQFLKWFVVNLGNYVLALALVAAAFFVVAMQGNNPLSDWVKAYIARNKPQPQPQPQQRDYKPNPPPPPDVKLAAYMEALDLFGLKDQAGRLKEDDCRARYKKLSKQSHPDSGGTNRMQANVNAAWIVICERHGWRK
jgi:hypothetical protein